MNTIHRIKTFAVAALAAVATAGNAAETGNDTIKIFDGTVFYDGYLVEKNPDSLVQDGILRHTTSHYATKLTDEQLNRIGEDLYMDVKVKACCDNYDRIGNINLAFAAKGAEKYDWKTTPRIELGRFITPFMNKNKKPDTVPYSYKIDYVSKILRDKSIRAQYDIWVEFELFGVPYAANTQIAGCANRSDVFAGYLSLITSKPTKGETEGNVLVPIVIKKPEYIGHNLNNYSEAGTDTIGKTTKTYTYSVPEDLSDGILVVVTSNHGANSGGEEYNRRWHYIYADDELVLTYKPGRTSCEPFRQYNTQANGIYGYSKMTDAMWQSFSNWCPGDVIDNRIINLGAVKKGTHRVRISVPDAVFNGGQGDIPVSIFFQGTTKGIVTGIGEQPSASTQYASLRIADGEIEVISDEGVAEISIYDMQGKKLCGNESQRKISTASLPKGLCLVGVELTNNITETHKVVIR